MIGTDTIDAKGEVEENAAISMIEAAEEKAAIPETEAAEEEVSSNKKSCGNPNKFLINFIRIMVDPEFMKNEKICDPTDADAKIDVAIDVLESYKIFKSVFDEYGNIRKDVSSEELQAVKSKVLKALEHIIATNDTKILMNVLKFLDPNPTNSSGFAYGPSTGFISSGYNPWRPNGNRWNGSCI